MRLVIDNTLVVRKGTLVVRAEQFAEKQFAGMVSPTKARTPLIYLCREVAELVEEARGTEEEIAAAWVFATLQAADVTLDEIQELFGRRVALVVEGVTDYQVSGELGIFERMVHRVRKLMYRSPSVKMVSYAYTVVSLRGIADDPPLEWDAKQCNEFVRGCWNLAQICYGSWPLLDSHFQLAYQAALAKHSYA